MQLTETRFFSYPIYLLLVSLREKLSTKHGTGSSTNRTSSTSFAGAKFVDGLGEYEELDINLFDSKSSTSLDEEVATKNC